MGPNWSKLLKGYCDSRLIHADWQRFVELGLLHLRLRLYLEGNSSDWQGCAMSFVERSVGGSDCESGADHEPVYICQICGKTLDFSAIWLHECIK